MINELKDKWNYENGIMANMLKKINELVKAVNKLEECKDGCASVLESMVKNDLPRLDKLEIATNDKNDAVSHIYKYHIPRLDKLEQLRADDIAEIYQNFAKLDNRINKLGSHRHEGHTLCDGVKSYYCTSEPICNSQIENPTVSKTESVEKNCESCLYRIYLGTSSGCARGSVCVWTPKQPKREDKLTNNPLRNIEQSVCNITIGVLDSKIKELQQVIQKVYELASGDYWDREETLTAIAELTKPYKGE